MMEIEEKTVNADGTVEAFIVKADAGDLCRLCANTDNQLIPIYRGEGLEHHISVKIEKHLPIIKVTEVDKLPLQICYQCASTLISWHNLYEGCLVADKRLREILAIDEKLCPEDESFGDYVDDYRDNYDDDTHETLPTSTNSSNVEANTSKDNSTVIPILSDTKVLNETDLEASDERLVDKKTGIVIVDTNEYEISIPDMVADDPLSSIVENRSRPKKTPSLRKKSTSTPVSSVKHVCTYCSLTFGSQVAIETHLKDLHGIVIPSTFQNVENIRIAEVPSLRRTRIQHKCALCLKTFRSRVAIERHLKMIHGGGVSNQPSSANLSQSASSCTVQISSAKVADESAQTSSTVQKSNARPQKPRVKHTCAFCSKKFRSKVGIERHLNEVHNGVVVSTSKVPKFDDKFYFTCENCGKKFSDKTALSRHLKKHSEQNAEPSVCKICDKKFCNRYVMQRHKKNYHGDDFDDDDEFWGNAVATPTAAEDELAEKLTVKIDDKKIYQCDRCPYKCRVRNRIIEHHRTHTGERPFCCDKCGRQFNNKSLLRNHLLYIHEGVKKFSCDICFKMFSSKHYADEHRRIHTGERPFVCDLCGSAYTHLTSLLTHKNRHSDLRKFKCKLCPESFTYRSALNLHTKRHTGDFRHKCGDCGKAFIDKQHLNRHVVVHSNARPFSCSVCGATFKLSKYLGSHMKTHRNKKE